MSKVFNIESGLEVLNFFELPEEQKNLIEKENLDDEEKRHEEEIYCFYRNQWHSIGSFIRIENNPWLGDVPDFLKNYHGYNSMGYVGGYLVKFEDNYNGVCTMAMY